MVDQTSTIEALVKSDFCQNVPQDICQNLTVEQQRLTKAIHIFRDLLKLESTQKDRNRYQLWLFFTKISFKQLHEERFEYFQVSNS